MNQRKISKSLMMMCRKRCTLPVKYRYILGMKSTNPLKEIGTAVHDIIDNYWRTGILAEYKPYTDNFKNVLTQLENFGIKLRPSRVQFFVEDEQCRGQVDFELIVDGKRCVGEIKTSKPPSKSKMSDMRLELGFYARIIDANYILALFLGGKGGMMFEPIKPALLKRVEKEITETKNLMKSGKFKQYLGVLCNYCDDSYKTLCGFEVLNQASAL